MKPVSTTRFATAAGVACALVTGCGKSEAPSGPQFKVQVAPLTLPGITNTLYRVTVTNGPNRTGEIVWQEESLSADDFGDGIGSLSYVGPCDADDPAVQNSVTIELLDLMTGDPTQVAVDDDEYVNPCAEVLGWATQADRDNLSLEDAEDQNGPCTINRTCVENADVLVEFNITVMRDANQGFFDVAVNFDDIFCSAKLDCRDQFLHDEDGDRNATAIVAFACTSGENEPTFLYASNLLLQCTNGQTIIPATTAAGQAGPIGAGVFQSATYIGDEQLTSNGEPLEKCYWNRAIGLDLANLAGPCTLSGIATASSTPLTPAMLIGEGATYPIITWTVPVINANGALCEENQLNAELSGVQTEYLDATTPNGAAIVAALLPPPLTAPLVGTGVVYACGVQSIECAAGPIVGSGPATVGAPDTVTATQVDDDTITVTTGGQTATIELTGALAGFTLGASCFQDDCCVDAP